jgi:hypothetical protein
VLFVTGYSSSDMVPPELRNVPRLLKPVDQGALQAALERILG